MSERIGCRINNNRSGILLQGKQEPIHNGFEKSGEVLGLDMDIKAGDGSVLNTLMFARIVGILGEPLILTIFINTTAQRKLEKQLQEAKKLEAVGTLAGGIAHEFNNLLMGIQGYTSMMRMDAEIPRSYFENLKGIENYVKRASDLTGQLLGFARRKI